MDFDRDRDENTPYTISDIARELHMEPESVRLAIKRVACPQGSRPLARGR